MRHLKTIAIGLAATCGLFGTPVRAAVVVSIEAAGAANSSITGYNLGIANLDNASNGLPTVSFTGSPITGTTTGGFVNIGGANVYGGAGGTGSFGTIAGDPATIQLSQAVNYFGLWGSALDGNNTVALYNNDTLLGTYALQSLLQSSPGFNNGYYSNPYGGGDSGEMFAFFNFTSDTAFDRVQLIENGGGGFEFDNLTVGTKAVSSAPEPATWMSMLLGFGMLGGVLRARREKAPILAFRIPAGR